MMESPVINFPAAARILVEATLKPIQGDRFQPTGFPDLGAATYMLPDGTSMLLVESPQSMANRLEATAWDSQKEDLVDCLKGLPYIRVLDKHGELLTTSILEAHRLNSSYILDSEDGFKDALSSELGSAGEIGAVDLKKAARVIFRYDPNSVLHGVFIARKELAGGRYRLPRLLSAFIEAERVQPVESGGVKNDRVNPAGPADQGYGNVPFHRTEYVAGSIKCYFSFDLSTLRSYAFEPEMERLLLGLALWKIQAFLNGNLRLRTACDLRVDGVSVTSPEGWSLPSYEQLSGELPRLIGECAGHFAEPPVTEVKWLKVPAKKVKGETEEAAGEESELDSEADEG